ncbi:DUF4905 domain-containing protein [Cesiribacter andamanensis]|uniref:DUF4905 domain-containing protein n=1 Tax=Cesiribacter andamanensis AMV16 TaxID=1279009 RepID=M7NW70_9BACT|nr:DUF4905 domain-containing protein [Cesiribacter andamanensis]EMR02699.1 hypothetical protein ADICEAN_02176 [Cesiribacter andamanensis AMV16]
MKKVLVRQLPLSFSYQAAGKIWHLQPDSVTKCLALEVRSNLQDVHFAYLCPAQDKVIFEGLALEGGILTSLLACHDGILLLQQYQELENPGSATVLALDSRQQEVRWAVQNYRPLFFTPTESIGKSGGGEENEESWVALKLQSGASRILAQAELAQLLAEQQGLKQQEQERYLPAAYLEGEEHFKSVAQFLQLYLQMNAQNSCEYLHVFDKIVISFYTADGELLQNHLAVFDLEGTLLLHQPLADGLKKPGADAFMVWNKHLFFIENSTCLRGYNLQ